MAAAAAAEEVGLKVAGVDLAAPFIEGLASEIGVSSAVARGILTGFGAEAGVASAAALASAFRDLFQRATGLKQQRKDAGTRGALPQQDVSAIQNAISRGIGITPSTAAVRAMFNNLKRSRAKARPVSGARERVSVGGGGEGIVRARPAPRPVTDQPASAQVAQPGGLSEEQLRPPRAQARPEVLKPFKGAASAAGGAQEEAQAEDQPVPERTISWARLAALVLRSRYPDVARMFPLAGSLRAGQTSASAIAIGLNDILVEMVHDDRLRMAGQIISIRRANQNNLHNQGSPMSVLIDVVERNLDAFGIFDAIDDIVARIGGWAGVTTSSLRDVLPVFAKESRDRQASGEFVPEQGRELPGPVPVIRSVSVGGQQEQALPQQERPLRTGSEPIEITMEGEELVKFLGELADQADARGSEEELRLGFDAREDGELDDLMDENIGDWGLPEDVEPAQREGIRERMRRLVPRLIDGHIPDPRIAGRVDAILARARAELARARAGAAAGVAGIAGVIGRAGVAAAGGLGGIAAGVAGRAAAGVAGIGPAARDANIRRILRGISIALPAAIISVGLTLIRQRLGRPRPPITGTETDPRVPDLPLPPKKDDECPDDDEGEHQPDSVPRPGNHQDELEVQDTFELTPAGFVPASMVNVDHSGGHRDIPLDLQNNFYDTTNRLVRSQLMNEAIRFSGKMYLPENPPRRPAMPPASFMNVKVENPSNRSEQQNGKPQDVNDKPVPPLNNAAIALETAEKAIDLFLKAKALRGLFR